MSVTSKTYEVVVDGSEAPEVVTSYVRAQEGLVHSFEDGLNELTKWINLQQDELGKDKIPLLEPLPAVTNVAGADFSYDKFFNEARDPKTFSTQVEQQRAKLREQQNRPAGLIGQRLDGTR